jgi:arylsulfatase A-like enzyme
VLPAERLREAGFRTAGIWRNQWVANNFGFDQGFDTYYQPKPGRSPDKLKRRGPGQAAIQGTDLDATDAALEFLRAYGRERFFLYVHYMDVHQYVFDQVAGDQGYGTKLADSYDAAIHWTDRNIGRLIRELDDRDLFSKTIVVVAADHGEGFYEHGREGHAQTLYGEVTNVPLILALPFRLERPVVVEPLVRNVDIWPTLYDLLGLPPTEPSDGRSLLPLIEAAARGEALPEDAPAAFAYLDETWTKEKRPPNPMVSVRLDGERLILHSAGPGRLELFDRRADPREQRDLAAARPERARELRSLAEDHLSEGAVWGGSSEVEIDELRRSQLQALGYVLDDDTRELHGTLPGKGAPKP